MLIQVPRDQLVYLVDDQVPHLLATQAPSVRRKELVDLGRRTDDDGGRERALIVDPARVVGVGRSGAERGAHIERRGEISDTTTQRGE